MKIQRKDGVPQLSWKVDYGKKNDYLTPSYDSVSENIRKKVKIDYYLMDEADRKAVKFMTDTFRENWEARCYESMGTLENFTKTLYDVMDNKKQKFYLRAIPPLFSDGLTRVFAEDVGFMLLAMRSGRIFEVNDVLFEDVCRNLTTSKHNAYCTLALDYIYKLFDTLDFDKSVITLVDDPVLVCGRKLIYQKGGHFTIRSCRMKPIISVPQGTLYLVHSLVCGVNWKKVTKVERDSIAAAIRRISGLDSLNYVDYSYVISIIIEEKKRFAHLYASKPPDFIFADKDPKDQVDIDYYTQVVKEFELMEFENNYKQFGVYMLRVLFVLGWIVNFCEERGYRRLAETVIDEVMNYVPETNQREYRVQIMALIRDTSSRKNKNQAAKTNIQNGNGTITNGEISENSGTLQIQIGPESDSCEYCERIQIQFLDIKNQHDANQEKRAKLLIERENYNIIIDQITEQNEEIKELEAKLEALDKAKPVVHSRSYAMDCRKLESDNQRASDKIKFYNNTCSEFTRSINTITKQNERDQAINLNLEQQCAELEKQFSHLSAFSTKIMEMQTKDQDRMIAELEESINNLKIKADRQEEIIKDLDKKAEPKIP